MLPAHFPPGLVSEDRCLVLPLLVAFPFCVSTRGTRITARAILVLAEERKGGRVSVRRASVSGVSGAATYLYDTYLPEILDASWRFRV